jgi:hypothetical protein
VPTGFPWLSKACTEAKFVVIPKNLFPRYGITSARLFDRTREEKRRGRQRDEEKETYWFQVSATLPSRTVMAATAALASRQSACPASRFMESKVSKSQCLVLDA